MARTIASSASIVWLSLTLTFLLLRVLPGDSVDAVLVQGGAGQERINMIRHELELDAGVTTQYWTYFTGLLRGDLGFSLFTGRSVNSLIGERLGTTLRLVGGAMSLSILLGLGIGIAAASEARSLISLLARGWIDLAFSVPIYWSATLAILLFAVMLHWLPAYEQGTLAGYVLPVGVLAFHTSGTIARLTQANVEAFQSAPFVWSARSRGLADRTLLWKHILPNALPPIVSVIALQTGFLLSGTVLVETSFLRNGLGRLLLDSVLNRDYAVVQGIVVLSAVSYTILHMLSSLVNTLLDPRLRH